jgi:hypothetical protein
MIIGIVQGQGMIDILACEFLAVPRSQHNRFQQVKVIFAISPKEKPFKNQEAVNLFKKMEMVSRSSFRDMSEKDKRQRRRPLLGSTLWGIE